MFTNSCLPRPRPGTLPAPVAHSRSPGKRAGWETPAGSGPRPGPRPSPRPYALQPPPPPLPAAPSAIPAPPRRGPHLQRLSPLPGWPARPAAELQRLAGLGPGRPPPALGPSSRGVGSGCTCRSGPALPADPPLPPSPGGRAGAGAGSAGFFPCTEVLHPGNE